MKNVSVDILDGFTLIELLVVVLIIGILAAVALPQYQLAVAKSRLANQVSLMTVLKEAEEEYYLKEGSYTDDMSVLTVNLDTCKQIYADIVQCGNSFMVNPLNSSHPNLLAYYCPNTIKENGDTVGVEVWDACWQQNDFVYTLWLSNSEQPDKRECTGRTVFGRKVCRSLNL